MKFLLDENISKKVAWFLIQLGYTTFRIKELHPGSEDLQVLELAVEKEAVLVTLDKDYGELIFKGNRSHSGVIFLRLDDQTADNTVKAISWFLSVYSEDKIINNFAVVIKEGSRFKARFAPGQRQVLC